MTRHGVTHGLWDRPVPEAVAKTLIEGPDPVLDRLVVSLPGGPQRRIWRLVQYPQPFPPARAATRIRVADAFASLLSGTDGDLDPQTAWFLLADRPRPASVPPASFARVSSFDGRTAVVEHDGSCVLVLNRTFYPGWLASVNGAEEHPVARAELGLQCVHLDGKGPSRVVFTYRPPYLWWAWPTSLGGGAMILLGVALGSAPLLRPLRPTTGPEQSNQQEGSTHDDRLRRGVESGPQRGDPQVPARTKQGHGRAKKSEESRDPAVGT
jgi:hypothetical protein